MCDFCQSFWPSFVSTILGVIIGIPIALWLNRVITERGLKLEQEQEEQRLRQALDTLKNALSVNINSLSSYLNNISKNQVPFQLGIDYSAWDAVKPEISQFLKDPKLKQEIAFHFSKLVNLTKLNEMYLDLSAGVSSALQSSRTTSTALRQHLIQTVQNLINEASQLVSTISDLTEP